MSDASDSLPWLHGRTILLTVAGSRAYGTNTAGSDVDLKGVAVPPREFYLGAFNRFEQADKPSHAARYLEDLLPEEQRVAQETKLEGTVFEVTKFIRLAADGNPNVLEVVFAPDANVRMERLGGALIRENRELFLSRTLKHRFAGYAISQLHRIKTHRKWLIDPPTAPPRREDFGLTERTSIAKDQLAAVQAAVAKQLDRWNEDFDDGTMTEGSKIRIREHIADYLSELQIAAEDRFTAAGRKLGLEENFLHLLQREREYAGAAQHWAQYQNWHANRNEDRAKLEREYGYDTKHAMHLVRLLRMCREILTRGEVLVRRPDAEELLAIRNGAWTYEEIAAWAEREELELEELYRGSRLPRQPDRKKLDELTVRIVESML